jgi:hypothetical protein
MIAERNHASIDNVQVNLLIPAMETRIPRAARKVSVEIGCFVRSMLQRAALPATSTRRAAFDVLGTQHGSLSTGSKCAALFLDNRVAESRQDEVEQCDTGFMVRYASWVRSVCQKWRQRTTSGSFR